MRKKLTAWGGGAVLVVATLTVPATTAAAVGGDILMPLPDNFVQTESTIAWSIEDDADDICASPNLLVNGNPQPSGLMTIDSDGRGGEFDLDVAASNDLFVSSFVIECGSDQFLGSLEFSKVEVTKEVIGAAHPGEVFEVEGTLEATTGETTTETVTFSNFGGTEAFYDFVAGPWSFEETEDGGAQSVSIVPETVEATDPGLYTVTVTNQFPIMVPVAVDFSDEFITTDGELGWELTNTDYPPVCGDGDAVTSGYLVSKDEEVTLDTPFDVTVNDDSTTGAIDVENAPGSGFYTTEVACENDGTTFIYTFNTAVDVFTLTKDVKGDAPSDAAFEIEVTASHPEWSANEPEHGPNPETLTVPFSASGGEQKFFHHTGEIFAYWTVEETEDGGADSVSIEDRNYLSAEGDSFATVTNTFDEADAPEDNGDDKDDDGDDDEEEKDDAPKAVKKQPAFTG